MAQDFYKNLEGQLARWLEKLAECSFKVEHKSGWKHNNADLLSWSPQLLPVNTITLSQPFIEGKTNQDLRTLQLEDSIIAPVLFSKREWHITYQQI